MIEFSVWADFFIVAFILGMWLLVVMGVLHCVAFILEVKETYFKKMKR